MQADGAAAGDEHSFSSGYASLLHSFQNRVNRLDERGFLEADIVGQRDNPALGHPGHSFYVFAETTAVGSEATRKTRRLVLFALGEETALAIEALAARDVMKAHHAVAQFPLRYSAAGCCDCSGYFMAQNLGRRNVGVVNLLDVGPTNATCGDFDEHFAVGHFGDGDFLDANDSLFAVDARAHGLGDGAKSLQGFECCSRPTHRSATFSESCPATAWTTSVT